MTTKKTECAELVRLMMEIAALDRDEYRRLRSRMWEAVARSHQGKGDQQLARWKASAC